MNRLVKIALVGALVAGAGISAAYTEPSGFAGGPSQRQFERFCGMDVTYFSDRIANRLTKRLNLTDVQKPVLKDLQDTFIKAATDAKALCNETPDTGTVVGGMAFAEKRDETMLNLMKAVQPKLEVFYNSLDDTQRATFNQIGQRDHDGADGKGRLDREQ